MDAKEFFVKIKKMCDENYKCIHCTLCEYCPLCDFDEYQFKFKVDPERINDVIDIVKNYKSESEK
jgi:hypothetical protein